MPAVGGVLLRDLVADHDLAFERLRAGLGVRERQHVGRLVVLEELIVEPVDVRVVDERERDLARLHALALEHGAGRVLELLELERGIRTGWRPRLEA